MGPLLTTVLTCYLSGSHAWKRRVPLGVCYEPKGNTADAEGAEEDTGCKAEDVSLPYAWYSWVRSRLWGREASALLTMPTSHKMV